MPAYKGSRPFLVHLTSAGILGGMTNQIVKILAACGIAATMAACATSQPGDANRADSEPDNQPQPMVVLVPVEIQNSALAAGCWAQLYDEREFKGDMVTLVGPIELQSLDKSTGRQLRRSIDSLVLGPKASLTVYEHRMFKDRAVKFAPNAREGGLVSKLGVTGRIESLQISCN